MGRSQNNPVLARARRVIQPSRMSLRAQVFCGGESLQMGWEQQRELEVEPEGVAELLQHHNRNFLADEKLLPMDEQKWF